MPETWAAKDAVNRKFRELWASKDAVNRKQNELWARDSGGVNRKIFSGFGWTYSYGEYNPASDSYGNDFFESTYANETFGFDSDGEYNDGNMQERYDFADPINIPAEGINCDTWGTSYGQNVWNQVKIGLIDKNGTEVYISSGGSWNSNIHLAFTDIVAVRAFMYFSHGADNKAASIGATISFATTNHGTFTLTPGGQP